MSDAPEIGARCKRCGYEITIEFAADVPNDELDPARRAHPERTGAPLRMRRPLARLGPVRGV